MYMYTYMYMCMNILVVHNYITYEAGLVQCSRTCRHRHMSNETYSFKHKQLNYILVCLILNVIKHKFYQNMQTYSQILSEAGLCICMYVCVCNIYIYIYIYAHIHISTQISKRYIHIYIYIYI